MAWQRMLPGNLRADLSTFIKDDWIGPEDTQGWEMKDGRFTRVRSNWTRPDGSRCEIVWSSNKITISPLARAS